MEKATLILCLVLGGCSTFSPRPNPWTVTPTEPVSRPLPLPERPDPVMLEQAGVQYAGFDLEGMRALSILLEAAEGNYEIAENLASALEESEKASQALSEAGRAEFALSEGYRRELEKERRMKLWDRVLWLGLGLTAIGVSK